MKKLVFLLLVLSCYNKILAQFNPPQELHFYNLGVKEGLPEGTVNALVYDKEGYMWIGTQNGLVRYDGYTAKKYILSGGELYSNTILRIYEDRKNDLWIGTFKGLYHYKRAEDMVYRQDLYNKNENIKNLAFSFFQDDVEGNIWAYFYDLDKKISSLGFLDVKNSHFTEYSNQEKGDHFVNSKSFKPPFADKLNKLWVPADNCLLEYMPAEKKFKPHYFDSAHKKIQWFYSEELWYKDSVKNADLWFAIKDKNAKNYQDLGRYSTQTNKLKIFHNVILDTLEGDHFAGTYYTDTKKRTWFFTRQGLCFFDAERDSFINYNIHKGLSTDDYPIKYYAFQDIKGNFWCMANKGISYFNPASGDFKRYIYNENATEGLLDDYIINLTLDNHGLPWIAVSQSGLQWLNKDRSKFTLYKNDPSQLHHFPGGEVNSFAEAADSTFWIGSTHGLYHWQPAIDSFIFIRFDKNVNKDVSAWQVMVDKKGLVWFQGDGSHDSFQGVYCYDPVTQKSKNYRYNKKDSLSLSNEDIRSIVEDKSGTIWIGTFGSGVCSFDKTTQKFTRYPYRMGDNISKPKRDSLDDDQVETMHLDDQGILWVGTNNGGLNKFDSEKRTFTSYLNDLPQFFCVINITNDTHGNIWSGTYFSGLFSLNPKTNTLKKFSEKDGLLYDGCWGLQEDDHNNLWIASKRGFSIMDLTTHKIRNITSANGLPVEPMGYGFYKTSTGNFLYGCKDGFVSFNPDDFVPDTIAPVMHIETVAFNNPQSSSNDKKDSSIVRYGKDKISLHYNENRITFSYVGLQYYDAAEVKYAYKLDGYDKSWLQAGTQRTTTYTNLSPGTYTFHVKAANSDGVWTTKEDAITVIISPPWWRTWWAYLIYAVAFLAALRAYVVYRSRTLRRKNKLLEERVERRTHQLSEANEELKVSQENIAAQRDELATTVDVLKSTQAQLIQSEKMASLGELTAGIAHEIQNPLNFVNNFSELNKELLEELKEEADKGNLDDVKTIANDVIENEQKINHHGKRADAIVKGMLQHSRKNTGKKEPTDLNALCDEYMRLSYHGLRAKDKSFNADFKTDFDQTIGNINIVPQDIGRVLLNLFNNAFYAVNEKKKSPQPLKGSEYKPLVTVTTKKVTSHSLGAAGSPSGAEGLQITVKDNGNGIPKNVIDKIFQPFFTTKPTGQGTGLGLSLSYDIITKEHKGTITVQSEENKGTQFIIAIPS